jgi:hypothetical protein
MTRIAAARLPDPQNDEAPPVGVGIGHNRPPVDEMARIDFNEAIDKHDGVRSRIAMLLDSSTRAIATNDEEAGRCAELIRQMGAVERVVEDERKATKEPYLLAGRAIDDAARTLISPLTEAKAKVRSTAESYMREKQRRIDEENRRREEEQRRREEEERARAAAEQREPDTVFEAAPARKEEPVQVRSDFGAVASARKVKVAVVTDWAKAFKAVKNVAAVQEAIQKAVNGLVRAGQTNIPGVEVREDVGLSVR